MRASREDLEREWKVEFRRTRVVERKMKLKELEKRFSRSFKKQLATTLRNSLEDATPTRSPARSSHRRKVPDPKLSMSVSTASILDEDAGVKRYEALEWDLDLEDSTPPYMFTSGGFALEGLSTPSKRARSKSARKKRTCRTLDFGVGSAPVVVAKSPADAIATTTTTGISTWIVRLIKNRGCARLVRCK